jgi:dipeptidyl aminopeptidase/acylaminoacyl peptidase
MRHRFALLAALAAFTSAAEGSGLGPKDLHALRSVREVAVRPDGSAILYTELDSRGAGPPVSELMLLDRRTTSGSIRKFRSSGLGGSSPRWSPDGKWVALLGPHDGAFGLVVTDADGGSERLIAPVLGTNHPLPSAGETLSWSPDSRSIAFLSATPGPESAEATGDPIVIRRYLYKPTASEGDTRFNDNRRVHLFLADLASGEPPRQITEGATYEHSLGFSPRGDEILFVSNREPDPDRFFNYDLFAVGVKDGSTRRLTRTENAEYRPRWSPDGTRIVYEGTTRGLTSSETTMEDTHVWIASADGSGRRELVGLDNRQSTPTWSFDGAWVYFTVQERGTVALYRVRSSGGESEPVVRERGRVGAFSLSADGGVAYSFHSVDDTAQLYWRDASGKTEKLTSPNESFLGDREIAPTESVVFKSFDGREVEAFLTLPLGRIGASRHPVIVSLKGGPHSQSGPELNPKAQVYAALGWATLQVNYRGSTGYGQELADAIFADQNGGEARDVLYAVDAALRRHEFLDPDRLGLEGGSYGGQLTNWIVTQTDRFRAAVPRAGIANLVSFNYMAYYHDYLAVEYGAFPHEEDLMDRLWQRSPLRYVARVKTPVLFLHGENDNDVPIAEAEQFYIALKDVGVETVLVRYPREGHGFRETAHVVDALERSVEWYQRFFDAAP